MKTEVTCPWCGSKRFKLVNDVGSYDVDIKCAQCSGHIGTFNGFGVGLEDKKNAKDND